MEGIGTIGAHLTYLNLGEQIQTNEAVPISSLSLTPMNWPLGFPTVLKLNKNLALGTSLRLIYSLASGTTVSQQKVNQEAVLALIWPIV